MIPMGATCVDGRRLVMNRETTEAYERMDPTVRDGITRSARMIADREGRTIEICAHDGVVLDRVEGYLVRRSER